MRRFSCIAFAIAVTFLTTPTFADDTPTRQSIKIDTSSKTADELYDILTGLCQTGQPFLVSIVDSRWDELPATCSTEQRHKDAQRKKRATDRRQKRVNSINEVETIWSGLPIVRLDLKVDGVEEKVYEPVMQEDAEDFPKFLTNGGMVLLAWTGEKWFHPHAVSQAIHPTDQGTLYLKAMFDMKKSQQARATTKPATKPETLADAKK